MEGSPHYTSKQIRGILQGDASNECVDKLRQHVDDCVECWMITLLNKASMNEDVHQREVEHCSNYYRDGAGGYCKLKPMDGEDYPHKHWRVMCYGHEDHSSCIKDKVEEAT